MIDGKGKFRYESNKTKHGKISIPSRIVKSLGFPFASGSSVKITLPDNKEYLVIEKINNGRIENIIDETITKCNIRDCENLNKIYGICTINHENTKNGCMNYKKDKVFLKNSLKEYINTKGKISSNIVHKIEPINNLAELNAIIEKQRGI